jgi:hypothetical protein
VPKALLPIFECQYLDHGWPLRLVLGEGRREVFAYIFELCYLPFSMFQGISVSEHKFHSGRLLWALDVAIAQCRWLIVEESGVHGGIPGDFGMMTKLASPLQSNGLCLQQDMQVEVIWN